MTPQHYPLGCIDEKNNRYLVLGWTSTLHPVAVIDSYGRRGKESRPHVLYQDVSFFTPSMSVSIDGEVSATIDGEVSAKVEGTKSGGGILTYGPND